MSSKLAVGCGLYPRIGFTNSECQVARENKFYTRASNICGSSVCNLLNVTNKIWWKDCAALSYHCLWGSAENLRITRVQAENRT
jgi:hypothetical protein